MKKQNNKLGRVLIFTYSMPTELDVKKLQELNDKYISELYESKDSLEEKRSLLKIFRKSIIPDTDVIFLETGLGKLNSYRALDTVLRETFEHATPNVMIKVVNLGTAGSDLEKVGSVVRCGRFIDVDMATLEIGNIRETEWCNQMYLYEPEGIDLDTDYMYSCNSRDKLVTRIDDSFQRRDGWKAICETEAFAQAECCEYWSKLFDNDINFSSLKFITHKFNPDALKERELNLLRACEELTKKASRHLYNFYYAKN